MTKTTCAYLAFTSVSLCFFAFVANAGAVDFPEGPGKEAFLKVCSQCHTPEVFLRLDQAGWKQEVDQMASWGAQGTKEDFEAVVNYLVDNFGLTSGARVNVNTADAKDLESGLRLTTKDAEAVVKHRLKHGRFKDWADLLKVDGLDRKKIEAVKGRIVF